MGLVSIIYIWVFVIGNFVGSFLNRISDKVIKGEDIIWGHSHCDFCKKPLGIKNLVPVFSFLFQKRRCSFCGRKLSWFYPASELFTGLVFVCAAYLSGFIKQPTYRNLWDLAFLLVVLSLFIILFLADAKYLLIPDVVVYWAIGLTAVFVILGYAFDLVSMYNKLAADPLGKYLIKVGYMEMQIKNTLYSLGITFSSAVVIALFFMFLVWVTKERGMGQGDTKLGFLLGIFNGFPGNFIAVFLGFVIGAIFSVILIALRKKSLKDTVPFGPFLILGSLLSLLYGRYLLDWYIHLF